MDHFPILALGKKAYGEILVIKDSEIKNIGEKLSDFCSYHGMNIFRRDGITVLSTELIKTDKNGLGYIFCGKALSKKYGLIFSSHGDIERHGIDVCELKENLGEYSLLIFEQNKLYFGADWYGMNVLYHYDFRGVTVVSTNGHLMLLVLVLLGEKLSLDTAGCLEFAKLLRLQYANNPKLVNNVHISNAWDFYELADKLEIKRSSFYSTVFEPPEWDEKKYERLIEEAKEEIIGNVRMCFEHSDIDQVGADLSGGLDSRIVLAACASLPEHLVRPKLRQFSRLSPTENDFIIALQLNKVYNYPFTNRTELKIQLPKPKENGIFDRDKASSVLLQNYYHGTYVFSCINVTNEAYMQGGCGDILRGNNASKHIGDVRNYINARNRNHFSALVEQSVHPLQTKAGINAAMMYMCKDFSTRHKVELDILTAVNPLLAVLPYANKDINDFIAKHRNILRNFPDIKSELPRLSENKTEAKPTISYDINTKPHRGELYDPLKSFDIVVKKLSNYSPDFEQFADVGAVKINEPKFLYKFLVALCFQIDIISGRGDFFKNKHEVDI